jgi:hypothetical protein
MAKNGENQMIQQLDDLKGKPVEVLAGDQEFRGVVYADCNGDGNGNGHKGNGHKGNGKKRKSGNGGAQYFFAHAVYEGNNGRQRVLAAQLPMDAQMEVVYDGGSGVIMLEQRLTFGPYQGGGEKVPETLRQMGV